MPKKNREHQILPNNKISRKKVIDVGNERKRENLAVPPEEDKPANPDPANVVHDPAAEEGALNQPANPAAAEEDILNQPADPAAAEEDILNQPVDPAAAEEDILNQPADPAAEEDVLNQPADPAAAEEDVLNQPADPLNQPVEEDILNQPADPAAEEDVLNQPVEEDILNQPADPAAEEDVLNQPVEKDILNQPADPAAAAEVDNVVVDDPLLEEDAAKVDNPLEDIVVDDPTEEEGILNKPNLRDPPEKGINNVGAAAASADVPMEVDGSNDYDEFYKPNRYAQERNGREYYAKKRNRDEFYLVDENTKRKKLAETLDDAGNKSYTYAKNSKGQFIPLVDENNKQSYFIVGDEVIFPKENGREVYLKAGGREFYPYVPAKQKEVYAKDEHLNPYFATNLNGTPYYAYYVNEEGHSVEYHPNDAIMFDDSGHPVYYQNHTLLVQVYPRNHEGTEYYLRDESNNPIYCLNLITGDEILPINSALEPYYAEKDGKEIYPQTSLGDEYYMRWEDTEIVAMNEKGDFYYAKNHQNDEIYPKNFVAEITKGKSTQKNLEKQDG